MVSDITVLSYLVVALIKYKDSFFVTMTEIGAVLAASTVLHIGYDVILFFFLGDAMMYLMADDIKQVCEKYGELCSEYGILEKHENAAEIFDAFSVWLEQDFWSQGCYAYFSVTKILMKINSQCLFWT